MTILTARVLWKAAVERAYGHSGPGLSRRLAQKRRKSLFDRP
ncbi:hypothetical protein [Rhizorhapis sp.]|nr:hypothetical protein [Rhizorhapis sp.]HKR16079.1 hypothetical protein [Rhizorhapis sp.]HKX36536.1 hypothetical protein [Rhizorhapis sp.]